MIGEAISGQWVPSKHCRSPVMSVHNATCFPPLSWQPSAMAPRERSSLRRGALGEAWSAMIGWRRYIQGSERTYPPTLLTASIYNTRVHPR